jgi:hypothetical protein
MSVKLTDDLRKTPREMSGRAEAQDAYPTSRRIGPEVPRISPPQPRRDTNEEYDYGTPFAVRDEKVEEDLFMQGPATTTDKELAKFQDRLRRGKVKLCRSCGGVMARSSRRILSAFSGVLLLAIGGALMVLYGLATNFYQTPWYIKFALPAAYYIGSIFVGVGVLFFFIRERVWACPQCKNVDKR